MLPGPAVDVALHHDLLTAIAWLPLYPGFEHPNVLAPDHWYIAHVLLQDFLCLHVDLKALDPVQFLTALFEQGVERGVGPGLAPATGELGVQGIIELAVRIGIVGKPAD